MAPVKDKLGQMNRQDAENIEIIRANLFIRGHVRVISRHSWLKKGIVYDSQR